MATTVARVVQGRAHLAGTLAELGAAPEPSQANFVFARFGRPERAAWVADALAGLGLAVRRFPSDPTLANALRITVPPDHDGQERLDGALRVALAPEALLFDVDGVLVDTSASYDAAILATAADLGVPLTEADIAARRADGDANNDWILTQQLLAERGVERPFDAVRDAFEAHMDAGLWRQERALLTAADLPDGLPLALVTGRPRRDLERTLERMGLADRFPVAVCMGDTAPKPSPAPVQRALELLGVQRAWMLGDTPDDVVAARDAGVVPLAVAPEGTDQTVVDALWRAGAARVGPDAVAVLKEALPWI
jgi:histidinol-phosphate aminotransferase